MSDRSRKQANRRVVRRALLLAVGMFGFGYLLVPMYSAVCAALGLNGQTRQISADASKDIVVDRDRMVTVTLDANTNTNLPWHFKPLLGRIEVRPGEFTRVEYEARNLSGTSIVGQAAHSVTPLGAAKYFKKSECFCYQQQPLLAGESKRMPVVFMVDPRLPAHIKEITLSYTFLRADQYAIAD